MYYYYWNINIQYSNYYIFYFRVAVAISPPFVTLAEDKCESSSCFQGVYADLFLRLKSALNFTFELRKENSFGTIKNGSWTGIIGTFSHILTLQYYRHIYEYIRVYQCSNTNTDI